MTRSVAEWIGRDDNTAIPPRVKLRIFLKAEGRCEKCLTWIPGKSPNFDHKVALINGGENRESNLQLLCAGCHKPKTQADVAEKAVTYRKRLQRAGIKKLRRTIGGRRFDGTPIPPKRKM